MKKIIKATIIIALLTFYSMQAHANGGINEIHYQYGKLKNPFSGESHATTIVTLQHASSWKYGSNFFFVDFLNDDHEDGFNDKDYYGEFYSNFSLSKITGADLQVGPLKDVGVILGVNAAGDSDILKYLPGMRLSWNIPGFIFLNTDITAYIDNSAFAVAQEDSYMIDINWARPFQFGNEHFAFVGHAEYIGERDKKSNGDKVKGHFLAQPQLRWDIGNTFLKEKDHFFAGIEYQYWDNKLGTKEDENVIQALFVIRL